jgi:hypothetical protein
MQMTKSIAASTVNDQNEGRDLWKIHRNCSRARMNETRIASRHNWRHDRRGWTKEDEIARKEAWKTVARRAEGGNKESRISRDTGRFRDLNLMTYGQIERGGRRRTEGWRERRERIRGRDVCQTRIRLSAWSRKDYHSIWVSEQVPVFLIVPVLRTAFNG